MIQRKLLYVGFALLTSTAQAANSGISYEGQIIKPNGSPLSGASAQFKLQIRTPGSEDCLMYEEIQTLNMSSSGGSFSLTLNDGSGSRTDTTGLTLDRIFANRGAFTFNPSTCTSGSGYTPALGDGRHLVVLFKDETMATWEPIPAETINYVPFALESKQVAGFGADSLLRVVDGSGDPLTGLAPLSNAQYTALMDLVNGTSSAFAKPNQLNGVILPAMAAGEVLGWNGTQWTSQPTASGPNSVGTTMIQNNAVDSTKIADGAIVANKLDPAISISTSGVVAAAVTTTRDFKVYAPSPSTFYVGMLADPTLAASYTLTWPLTSGSANQVLTTDGSGKLTWTTPTASGDFKADGSVSMTGAFNMGGQNIVNVTQITANGALNAGDGSAAFPSHTFANETQTGLFKAATGTLGFSTNGSEKMRIDSSGNVGIGTSTPTYKLDVAGDVNVTGSFKVNGANISSTPTGPATGDLSGTYPTPTVAIVGGSTAVNIHTAEVLANAATSANTANTIVKRDGTGSLAVGDITSSSVKLDNAGSILNIVNPIGGAWTMTLPATAGSNGQVLMTDGSGVLSWSTAGGGSQWANNGSDISYISGNVGIGTAAPSAKLEVVGGGIKADTLQANSTGTIGSACATDGQIANSVSVGGLVVCTSGTWKMPGPWDISSGIYYTPTGNKISLGAGISGASTAVHVKNNVAPSYSVMRIEAMSGQTAPLMEVVDAGGLNAKFTITGDGRVGIGTTSPQSALEINGGLARRFVTNTASTYPVTDFDTHILMNPTAAATLVLPSASAFPGREISIRNISSYAISSSLSNVVPMASSATVTAILPASSPGKWVLLVSDGVNWQTQMGN